jgi:uncharacterized protein (DUF1684 family)
MSYTLNNWLDLSNVSNLFKSIYVKGFVDISGGDFISRNGNLHIAGNANLGNAYIVNNIGIGVSGSIYQLDVSGSSQIRNQLVVLGDASINGNIITPTPATADNSNKVATTAYVQNQGYATSAYVQSQNSSALNNLSANYAPLVAPTFSGTLTSTGDASINTRLFVGQDASLNANLYVLSKTILGGDASLNSGLFVSKDSSLNGNLYVSSKTIMGGDASLNSGLFVAKDASLNGNLYVANKTIIGGDASLNSGLFVSKDASLNANLYVANKTIIGGDASLNSGLFVSKDSSLNGNLYVSSKTIIGGDASLNSGLFVSKDASLNGNVYVANKLTVGGDLSLNGNLTVHGTIAIQQLTNVNYINTTTTNYQLIISEDISLNGRLLTSGDVSLNSRLSVAQDASFNSRVFVASDVSMGGRLFASGTINANGGLIVPTGQTLVATGEITNTGGISGTGAITTTGTLSVTGSSDASFNNRLLVGSDVSMGGRLFASGSINANGGLVVPTGQTLVATGAITNTGGISGTGAITTTGLLSVTGSSDASFNNRVLVGGDVSMGGRLFASGSINANGGLVVPTGQTLVATGAITNTGGISGTGAITTTGALSVTGSSDASFNNRLLVGSDLSLGGRLFASGVINANGGLIVPTGQTLVATGAITNTGGISGVGAITTTGTLSVTGSSDASFNNRVLVGGDVSMGGRLFVQGTTNLGGDLTVVGNILPAVANVYNLGSDNLPFKSVYINTNSINFTTGGTSAAVSFNSSTGGLDVSSNGTTKAAVISTAGNVSIGNLAIGKSTPTVPLDVSGNSNFSGTIVVGSDASFNSRVLVGSDVSMGGRLFVQGTSTFQSGATFVTAPSMSGASIQSGTIPITSVVGTAADLTTSQTLAGTKTFSSQIVASNGILSVTDASINARVLVQSDVSMGGRLYVQGASNFQGLATLQTAPSMSGASIQSGTIPITSVVGTAADLTTSQTLGGTKTFSSQIVASAGILSVADASINNRVLVGSDVSMGGRLFVQGSATIQGAATFQSGATFVTAPNMSGASIQSATIPITSVVGTAADLTTSQTVGGTKTFSSQIVASSGILSVTDASINARVLVGSDVSMGGRLFVQGTSTFQSGATFVTAPNMSGASIQSGTIPIASVVGTAADLTTSQTFGGIKTFSNQIVATGGLLSINDASINSRVLVGSDVSMGGRLYVQGSATIQGAATFQTAPSMSGANIQSGTIPIASIVGTAADLTTSQTLGGTKTFSNQIVASAGILSVADASINARVLVGSDVSMGGRLFVQGAASFATAPNMSGANIQSGTIPIASVAGTAADLTTSQTLAGIKTFSSQIVASNGILSVADSSFNSRVLVGSDVSMGGRLFVKGDSELGGNLVIKGNLIVEQSFRQQNIINSTINNYQLIVSEDISLNGRLFVSGDASLNSRLLVGQDASFNSRVLVGSDVSMGGRLFVQGASTFQGATTFTTPPTMSGANITPGTIPTASFTGSFVDTNSSQTISGAKTFSSQIVASGGISSNSDISLNTNLLVNGDVSMNSRLNVSQDASFNSRIIVGSDVSMGGRLYVQNAATFQGAATIQGAATFQTAPTMSGANIQTGTIPTAALSGSFVDTNSTQTIVGIKTFTNQIIATGGLSSVSDISINSRVLVGSDVSLGGRLYVQGTSIFQSGVIFSAAPAMSGANIQNGSIPIASVAGTAMDITNAQTVAGIKTFSNQIVATGGLLSINDASINSRVLVGSDVSMGGRLFVQGLATFTTAPSMSGASIQIGTVPITSVAGTAMDITNAQTVAGIKTFSNQIVASSGILSLADASFNSRVLVGSDVSMGGRLYVQGASNFQGLATFVTPPSMSGASIQSGSIPITSILGTAMDITNTQTVAGTKTFSNQIVATGGLLSIADASINSRVLVGSDVSMGGRLFVQGTAAFQNTTTFQGLATFTTAPSMSGASIQSGTIPIAAVAGTAMDITNAQTVAGIKTFSNQIVATNGILSVADASVNSRVLVGSDVSMGGRLFVQGTSNFQSSATFQSAATFQTAPSMSGASIQSGSIPITSILGTAMDITNAQTVAGTKTFSNQIVASTGILSVADASVNSRVLVGSDVSMGGRLFVQGASNFQSAATFQGLATFQGAATFQNAPSMSGASIQSGTIPIAAVAGTAMDITNAQTVAGTKTFSNQIVATGGLLSINDASFNSRVLVGSDVSMGGRLFVQGTATFVEPPSLFGNNIQIGTIPIASILGTAADLTTTQTVGGTKTFSSQIVASNGILSIADASINARVLVGSDVSMGGRLFVGGDTELSGNLVIKGGLIVRQLQQTNIINSTTTNYQLIVSEDISLNGRLLVSRDASFGGKLFVANDLSVNGNTYVGRDLSLGGNIFLPSNSQIYLGGSPFSNGITLKEYSSITNQVSGNVITSVNTLAFDTEAGFTVQPNGTGAVLVGMNSTFKYWNVVGQAPSSNLVASGLDTINFAPGQHISIATSAPNGNKTLSIETNFTSDVSMGSRLIVVGDTSVNSRILVGSDVSMGGRLFVQGSATVQGLATFVTAPSMAGNNIQSGTIPIASIVGTAADLTTSQTLGGTKTFSNQIVANSGILSVADASINSRVLVGSDVSMGGRLYVQGSAIFQSGATFITAPSMSGASIQTSTIPIASIVGTAMDITNAQTVAGTKTFSNQIVASTGILSVADASFNNRVLVGSDVSMGGRLYVQGSSNFQSAATFQIAPSMAGNNIQSGTIPIASIVGTAMDITNAQTVAGTKTFSNQIVASTGILSVADSSFNNRVLVGSDVSMGGRLYVQGAAAFQGLTTFQTAPSMSGASIQSGTIPLTSVVGTAVDIASAQTVVGIKTFSNQIVATNGILSVADASLNNRVLVGSDVSMGGRLFVQGSATIQGAATFITAPSMAGNNIQAGTIPLTSVVGTAMDITNAQTVAGTKTFSNQIVASTGILSVADSSFNNRVLVGSDVSMGGRLFVQGTSAFQSAATFQGLATFITAPSMAGNNIQAGTIPITSVVGTAMDITSQQTVAGTKTFSNQIVATAGILSVADSSFNNRVLVGSDVSMGGRLYVQGTSIFQSGATFQNTATFQTAPSMAGNNIQAGTIPITSVVGTAMDITSQQTVAGTKTFSNQIVATSGILSVADASFNNRVLVGSDVSMGGRLFVKGTTNLGGDLTIFGNILPATANVYNLGSATQPFNSVYINTNSINFTTGGTSAAVSFNETTGGLDVSSNGSTKTAVISTLGNVIIGNNLAIGKAAPNVALDVSGAALITMDVSLGSRLFVRQDVSVNSRLLVGSDVSMGGRLFVQGAATFQTAPSMSGASIQSGTIPITSVVGTAMDITNVQTVAGTKTFSNQIVATNGILSVGDVSFNSRVLVGSDVSMGGRLFVQGDTSLNGNLLVKGFLIVQQGQSNQNIINTTTTNYQLIVSEDISLNGRLFVSGDVSMGGRLLVQGFTTHIGDASFNSRVIIGSDLSLGGRIFLPNNSVADSALSANIVTLAGSQTLTNKTLTSPTLTSPIISSISNSGTITIPTGTFTLATLTGIETLINKTITTSGLLTVGSGLVMTAGDASFNNRILVGSDVSMGGRLYVQGSAIFQTAPTMSGANIATGTIPSTAIAGGVQTNGMDLSTNQTVNGIKTFGNIITASGGIVSYSDVSFAGNLIVSKNIGIGTTTPQFAVDAQGGGVNCGRVIQFGTTGSNIVGSGGSGGVGGLVVFNGGTVTNDISLNTRLFVGQDTSLNGNVFVSRGLAINKPTITAGYVLDISGAAQGTSFTTTSDYRIKENPIPLDSTFRVDSLNPVYYFNKSIQKHEIGLLAHELQSHYPYLVNGEKDGENLQSINYTGLIGLLIKEIQDAKKEIQELKAIVNSRV